MKEVIDIQKLLRRQKAYMKGILVMTVAQNDFI